MASALGLGACTSSPTTDARIWSGRMAVTVHDTPPQNFTGSFELQGSPEAGRLTLLSPLGTTLAHLRWNAQGAQWQRGNEWESRPNLDELMRDLIGTEVPVSHLFAWLRGEFTRTEGWNVDLSRHADGRIQAQRETPLPRAELRVLFEP